MVKYQKLLNVCCLVVVVLLMAACGKATTASTGTPIPSTNTPVPTDGAISDNTIIIKKGNSILVDGKIAEGEWNDADSVQITIDSEHVVTVYFKHDGIDLYFAFTNLMGSGSTQRAAEIEFDLDNNKSSDWDSFDWWFHASNSDCDAKGQYFVWDNCQSTRSGWKANNLPLNQENDTIEFAISLAKFEIDLLNEDTIGIAFNVGDAYDNIAYWPSTAVIESPSTWGECVIVEH